MKPIRAMVFDFDGLILETEEPDFNSWDEVFQRYGHRLPRDEWSRCIGAHAESYDPCGRLEDLLHAPLDREAIRIERRRRFQEMVNGLSPLPGVVDRIMEARNLGIVLAGASSSPSSWVQLHLRRLGLDDFFVCWRCRDDVARVKPFPDLYESVIKELCVDPDEAVAFEDSPNGVQSAVSAGLYCVAVPNPMTRDLPMPGALLRLQSLADCTAEFIFSEISRFIGRDEII